MLRKFKRVTCEAYDTRELDKKSFGDLKKGRSSRKSKPKASASKGKQKATTLDTDTTINSAAALQTKAKGKKEFNLDTAKVHDLEHCVPDIWAFGATGSFSTEPVFNFKLPVASEFVIDAINQGGNGTQDREALLHQDQQNQDSTASRAVGTKGGIVSYDGQTRPIQALACPQAAWKEKGEKEKGGQETA